MRQAGWPVYAVTSTGRVCTVGATRKGEVCYLVPDDTEYIVSAVPTNLANLRFTVFTADGEYAGTVHYYRKIGKWSGTLQEVLSALMRELGEEDPQIWSPDYCGREATREDMERRVRISR